MSFNASISTLGIKDRKAQQAILRLLENTTYLNQKIGNDVRMLKQELERLKALISKQ